MDNQEIHCFFAARVSVFSSASYIPSQLTKLSENSKEKTSWLTVYRLLQDSRLVRCLMPEDI